MAWITRSLLLLLLFGPVLFAQDEKAPRVIATFVGGKHFDRAQGVAVDKGGNIYFIINTESSDLTVRSPAEAGPYQPKKAGPAVGTIRARHHCSDAYVGKLSPDGKRLIWGTYLGGSHSDRGYTLKVAPDGGVICSIWTSSEDFPTTEGAFDRTYNGKPNQGNGHRSMDLAICKLSADGSKLLWSTYLGGRRVDQSRNALDVDGEGNVYVAGLTASPDFPTTDGVPQPKMAGDHDDAFVCKLSADGSKLVWSTFLGGTQRESAVSGVRVHSDGSVVVAGMSRSADFPTTEGAFQRKHAGNGGDRKWMGDAFVSRLSADGKRWIYSTLLGGSGSDAVAGNDGLALTADGEAVVIIDTTSADMPLVEGGKPFQPRFKSGGKWPTDGYIARLSADGKTLRAATYLGGTGTEQTSGVAVDPNGNVHLSGNTASTDFPTTKGALGSALAGKVDIFYAVLSADLRTLRYATLYGGTGTDRGRELAWHRDGVLIGGDSDSPLELPGGGFQPRLKGNRDAIILRIVRRVE